MNPISRIGWQRGMSDNETAARAGHGGAPSRDIEDRIRDRPDELLVEREWLVTNGLGGYACGTVSGVATRRYHGLLIAALPNPLGRTMVLDHLVEQVRLADGSWKRLGVDETETSDGSSDASSDGSSGGSSGGFRHGSGLLEQFRLELGLPVWTYRAEGCVIEKRVILAHMQNTVYVRYRLLAGPFPDQHGGAIWLSLRPSMHFRPHDAPVSVPIEPYTLSLTGNRFEVSAQASAPSLKIHIEGDNPNFEFFPERQEKLNYRWEAARGYEARGTLWSPGQFKMLLSSASPAVLVASTESWETMTAVSPLQAWDFEQERRNRLLHAAPGALGDLTTCELVLAADQFVIAPAGRIEDAARARAQGEELRSVIAGYHWFTDWGRDTMISLEGLTLCTGRYQTAHFILHSFARYVRNGLIPNLFPEGAREGLYHTADATLWFFHALDRYLAHTGDRETLRALLPTLERIIDAHVRGTVFGIGVDPADGLLRQGQEGFALTWMDALFEGWVVTPRRGKAVEINALWFNALTLMGEWVASERGNEAAAAYVGMAKTAQQSFNRSFWNEAGGRLFDVIDGPSDCPRDAALRPNQIFAVSLPHPVLHPSRWKAIVDVTVSSLLTPLGLRSLGPDEPDFKASYHGDLRTRDAAYHQGTVWSWLIGPLIDAWLKVYPGEREKARGLLHGLRDHLGQACIGSVSEIFDAEAPYLPRGAVAQAWGVAELLRAWRLTDPSAPTPPRTAPSSRSSTSAS